MKNIHLIPTDKVSDLLLCIKDYVEHEGSYAENSDKKGNFTLGVGIYANTEFYQYQNIYITSSNDIEVGDYYYLPRVNSIYKCIEDATGLNLERRLGVGKIVLTTDPELINDGVQGIDDEFLEWFVKNPGCDYVKVVLNEVSYFIEDNIYRIAIPKEEPKQTDENGKPLTYWGGLAEHKQNRSYSEEEVLELLLKMNDWPTTFVNEEEVKEWFEQFKKK